MTNPRNEPDIHVVHIESVGQIQESLNGLIFNASINDVYQLFDSFPDSFLSNKSEFEILLQIIISNMYLASKRSRITLLFLQKMIEQVKSFFHNDKQRLIQMISPYPFIFEWLLENDIIDIQTIINEAKTNKKITRYFLPEILELKPDLVFMIRGFQKEFYLPISDKTDNSNNFTAKELQEIKNRRKKQVKALLSTKDEYNSYNSYDPNQLRCSLICDDLNKFIEVISKDNISVNFYCPPSVYDPQYFPFDDNAKSSLIEAAALFGSKEIFKYLLSNEAELRPEHIYKQALFGKNKEILEMLENSIISKASLIKIDYKEHKCKRDSTANTLLNIYMGYMSDENENKNKSVMVFNPDVDHNQKVQLYLSNAIKFAIEFGYDEIAEFLLNKYDIMVDFQINMDMFSNRIANFCMKDFQKRICNALLLTFPQNRILMSASYFNYIDLMEFILKHHASDTNIIDSKNRQTALSSAIESHASKAMQILLERPNFEYTYDSASEITPFTMATTKGYIDIMQYLYNFKANNQNNRRFYNMLDQREILSAFNLALAKNQGEALKFILNQFPNINFFSTKLKYNVKYAAKTNCWDSIKSLKELIISKKYYYQTQFPEFSKQNISKFIEEFVE